MLFWILWLRLQPSDRLVRNHPKRNRQMAPWSSRRRVNPPEWTPVAALACVKQINGPNRVELIMARKRWRECADGYFILEKKDKNVSLNIIFEMIILGKMTICVNVWEVMTAWRLDKPLYTDKKTVKKIWRGKLTLWNKDRRTRASWGWWLSG